MVYLISEHKIGSSSLRQVNVLGTKKIPVESGKTTFIWQNTAINHKYLTLLKKSTLLVSVHKKSYWMS